MAAEEAERLYRAGIQALRDDHNAEQARALLNESLRLAPYNERGWLWLARTYGGQPAQARRCIERALSINPGDDDALRALLRQPDAESAVERLADLHAEDHPDIALDLLSRALVLRPNTARWQVKAGDLHTRLGQTAEATRAYDRAARDSADASARRTADRALRGSRPLLTDHERGSVGLALREAAGFGVLAALLAFQDAGLSLNQVGAARWSGVGLALVGGYMLVTATSSPQQPLGRYFGGHVPTVTTSERGPIEEETHLPILPETLRWVFGAVGVAVLVMAFALVFSRSLGLLAYPIAPPVPVEP